MGMERDASKMFDWFRSDQPAAGVGGRRSALRSRRKGGRRFQVSVFSEEEGAGPKPEH